MNYDDLRKTYVATIQAALPEGEKRANAIKALDAFAAAFELLTLTKRRLFDENAAATEFTFTGPGGTWLAQRCDRGWRVIIDPPRGPMTGHWVDRTTAIAVAKARALGTGCAVCGKAFAYPARASAARRARCAGSRGTVREPHGRAARQA